MWSWILGGVCGFLLLVLVYDLTQRRHAILRNYPLIGHLRYILEAVGPELRQYIVTDNDEERPFNRDQRRWVYASSKKQNSYFAFGTDNELERSANYLIIKHSAFPLNAPHKDDPGYDALYRIPCAKVMGGYRKRRHAFRPESVVNVSGMSFGSLGAPAVQALNAGCKIAHCLQNTGEGGVSPHHKQGGGLIWQIGTGHFGCRELDGRFSLTRLKENLERYPEVKALEIKLSQGAKPGAGGILPKEKITREIAEIRGIPRDRDCVSPPAHREFSDVSGLLDFVERLAEATGLPVGIKSAVGQMQFWDELVKQMEHSGRGVDFISIDGGEGGTGAGPLVFTDHVSLPFKKGFSRVFSRFEERGLAEHIVFNGSAKLGFPDAAFFAFGLGCDLVSVAREAMLALGCIQAQRCHTNHCPAGVATQNPWLLRGLDPQLKSVRVANYVINLRAELLKLSHACGLEHPALVEPAHLEILDDNFGSRSIGQVFGYPDHFGQRSAEKKAEIARLMQFS